MLRVSRFKILSIWFLAIGACFFASPNLFPSSWLKTIRSYAQSPLGFFLPYKTVVLGLDLQGGSHLLLEIKDSDLIKARVSSLRDDIRQAAREMRVSLSGGIQLHPKGVSCLVQNPEERIKLLAKIQELSKPVGATFGQSVGQTLNVQTDKEGLITVSLSEESIKSSIIRARSQAIEVLRRRVDALGTTEPNIQSQGERRIVVEVPGLDDPQRLRDILGKTAKLEFRFLAEPSENPINMESLPGRDFNGQDVGVERQVVVEGADLVDAQPSFDQRTGEPIVNFRFNMRGAGRFAQATTENVGRMLAIVLDNEVISAPRILQPIVGGQGQISGHFTVEQANNLAILLRSGALPVALTIVEERIVGPSLGQDSIAAGKLATYVGMTLVIAFMFMTYGLFGLFANIAVIMHVVLILAVMSLLGITLTFPGIAGIVLTIGTAVDSNILIYERIREEARLGHSIPAALEAGFSRAFRTILDSNCTLLIAAVALFLVGSGPIRGFAVTMIIGVLTTIVTAVTMTRMLIAAWYNRRRPKALPI
jgi:preprotein translocase subunit SecD